MQELNGILIMNKPPDFTSFDVIAKLRGILKTRRLGHTGTLDPMATGVLPVLIGKATRALDILPNSDKRYCAGFRLGITTDTEDSTGITLTTHSTAHISADMVENSVNEFCGNITQIVPMYSAVSVGGKRLYELARQGITDAPRPSREIMIYEINLLEYNAELGEGVLDVYCSKGTYIRTLIADIGAKLGCGGIMTSLKRTYASGFNLDNALTFANLESLNQNFPSVIHPIETAFCSLPRLMLDEVQTKMYLNGVRLNANRVNFAQVEDCGKSVENKENGLLTVYGTSSIVTACNEITEFLGTAWIDYETMEVIIGKILR